MPARMIKSICPECEEMVEIPEGEIILAINEAIRTRGPILVGCPKCSYGLQLPADLRDQEVLLPYFVTVGQEEGIAKICECVAATTIEATRFPTGSKEIPRGSGVFFYQPAQGAAPSSAYPDGLKRRAYLRTFGIDPQIYLGMQGRGKAPKEGTTPVKPFVAGGRK